MSVELCATCGHGPEDHFWSVKDNEYYCQGTKLTDCECAFYVAVDWKKQ